MKNTYLFINTIDESKSVSFAIFDSRGEIASSHEFVEKQENLNEELAVFFRKNRVNAGGIKAVLVLSGPGSFSASRAGTVLANSFNFLYETPVLGVKNAGCPVKQIIDENLSALRRAEKTSTAEVSYEKSPNITA